MILKVINGHWLYACHSYFTVLFRETKEIQQADCPQASISSDLGYLSHFFFCTQDAVLQWNAEEEQTSVDSGQCVFKKYEQLWFKGSWKQLTTPRKCLPWLTSSPAWWRRSCLGGILSAPDPDLLISLLNSSQLLRDLLKTRCPWRYLHILSIFFLVTCIQGSAREISIVVHPWYTWIKSPG